MFIDRLTLSVDSSECKIVFEVTLRKHLPVSYLCLKSVNCRVVTRNKNRTRKGGLKTGCADGLVDLDCLDA